MSVYVLVNISNNKITFIEFACFGDTYVNVDNVLDEFICINLHT